MKAVTTHIAQQENYRPVAGIALRLIATAALGLMFALVKLSATRGVNIVESAFFRHAFAWPLVVGWIAIGPGLSSIATQRIGAHTSRMIIGLTAMILNFLGFIFLPFAEATTIGFAVPLFATVLAALILHEPTGRFRWAAVVTGFIGVLIVLRPSSAGMLNVEHGLGAMVALAGAITTASVTILIRRLGATEPAATTVFWFTTLALAPTGLAMIVYAQSHDLVTWLQLLGIGLSGGIAQLCLTGALRFAPVAVVMPMDYTGLIWATAFGWLIFGTLPVATTLVGAPIIIASGLAILWREHRVGRMGNQNAVGGIAD